MITISDSLVMDILDNLGLPLKAPTLRYVNRLIHAYIRNVPWESVSRIIKRHTTPETKNCPRLPEEFWQDAIQYGLGGTCFESSLAFFSLLMALGYEGYLTVNDMSDTRRCHAAITLLLNGQKYLVDVTIPIHAALRIYSQKVIRRKTTFHDYTVRPVGDDTYEIERSHHPSRNAFTLIDIPVSLAEYQMILENDYSETGYFLNSVVMVKVIDDRTWRFFSDLIPYRLESFNRTGKRETFIDAELLSRVLAGLFEMPEARISTALTWLNTPVTSPSLAAVGSNHEFTYFR